MGMDAATLASLNRINEEFYQTFAASFSNTRRKVQPGVEKILKNLPIEGSWLDIGCGNGNFADAWRKSKRKGTFVGLDFSEGLIRDASGVEDKAASDQRMMFVTADMTRPGWTNTLPDLKWNGIFCFAVLHHIPGDRQRLKMCAQVRSLLGKHSAFYISVWQPLNSERLKKRIQPWSAAGIAGDAVNSGDVLMEWRAHLTAPEDQPALRYVHIFNEAELIDLAEKSGFMVRETFYSDGKEGNLGLYQAWEPVF